MPRTLQSQRVIAIALQLAQRRKLTAVLLSRRGNVSLRRARAVIAELRRQVHIRACGCDTMQRAGRPRSVYEIV
jgi:predicted nucleic acid-binding protein